ncbi:Hypothetical protein Y17_4657 [Pectobacterium wasabiae CFBP 3304]|nr:Hypothetical protein Y17_4657 [Pectobacterium wasabiae CFBP 3304]
MCSLKEDPCLYYDVKRAWEKYISIILQVACALAVSLGTLTCASLVESAVSSVKIGLWQICQSPESLDNYFKSKLAASFSFITRVM